MPHEFPLWPAVYQQMQRLPADDRIRAAFWLDLLEDALLSHGWFRADPAVPNFEVPDLLPPA